MQIRYTDGGRRAAGFTRHASGDCVARAVAIASGRPYAEVYAALAAGNADERHSRRRHKASGRFTADHGIHVQRKWFKDYMRSIGFVWTSTMGIGTGCRVHLRAAELPSGRLVVALSRHYTAVVDGVVCDVVDPSRGGTRCVYGYWTLEK